MSRSMRASSPETSFAAGDRQAAKEGIRLAAIAAKAIVGFAVRIGSSDIERDSILVSIGLMTSIWAMGRRIRPGGS